VTRVIGRIVTLILQSIDESNVPSRIIHGEREVSVRTDIIQEFVHACDEIDCMSLASFLTGQTGEIRMFETQSDGTSRLVVEV